MLENKFYKILNINQSDDCSYSIIIQLCVDCDVYNGHFQCHAIAPGVCNIQLVRECVEKILSKSLQIDNIKQVKFLTLVEPSIGNVYSVNLSINKSDKIDVVAHMSLDTTDCMTIKMSLI